MPFSPSRREAAEHSQDPDRHVRYRLRKARERRRRELPIEEELTTIYIEDAGEAPQPALPRTRPPSDL